jgi:hypothetical protein
MVRPDDIRNKSDHVIAVTLKTGEIVEFDSFGGRLDRDRQEVIGYTKDKKPVSIPYADVVSATVERTNTASVVIPIVLIVALVVVLAAAAADDDDPPPPTTTGSSSCPYVYAFDGSRYMLDAEPLAGAISKGLERNDLCRLDHLRVHDGKYELLVRNELQETQYLDAMKLRVVDHPRGSQAYSDAGGAIHVIADPLAATEARDEKGIDLRAMIKAPDNIPWQSVMPTAESWRDMTLRHEMTFSFPRPAGKNEGSLVVGATTSLWGSIMMREMMQARGDRLADWHRSIDTGGPAMEEMMRFSMREELYFLKLEILEGGQWVNRAWIPGGGPMVTETRVIPLDLSGVTGDTVTMRVRPPRGFWSLDYLAMSYTEHAVSKSTEISVKSATLGNGADATPAITAPDGAYHEMKLVGDSMLLTFDAPGTAAEGERTIFLDTRGYYRAQVDETQPEQTALIAEMLQNDGAITRYSLQKFVEYVGRTASR